MPTIDKRRFLGALIALVAAALLATAAQANLSPGTRAPDFTLPTIDGKTFTLSNYFKAPQQVVVLDLWATWCPPCKGEIPYLIELQKKIKGKGATVVGVALDQDKNAAVTFARQQRINYPVPVDPSAAKLADAYDVGAVPATYVIDKKGTIRYAHSGFPRDRSGQQKEAAKIAREVKTLLGQK